MKKDYKYILISFIIISIIIISGTKTTLAQNQNRTLVNDWYIKDLDTILTLNKNSSLDVVEKITADCGLAQNKHGIYRTIPREITTKKGKTIITPIHLVSITDLYGHPYKYEIINSNKEVTWQIGDPNRTVYGVNYYLIHYKVDNVIRPDNPSFDEFYWNILGTSWDLNIDNFHAKIILPQEINEKNTKVSYYTGYLGETNQNLAYYKWTSPNIIEVYSTQPFNKKQGITISLAFPKNIFIPFRFSFWMKTKIFLSKFGWYLIPLFTLIICYVIWKKYGKDAQANKAIMPIYDIPEGMSPLEMGTLMSKTQTINTNTITAEIINLAVNGWITIKEIKKNILFVHSKDYLLVKNPTQKAKGSLNLPESKILDGLFGGKNEVKLSYLKFHKPFNIKIIQNQVRDILVQKGFISKKGINLSKQFLIFTTLGITLAGFIVTVIALTISHAKSSNGMLSPFSLIYFYISLFASVIIITLFALIMPARTQKGAEAFWQIQGFKLFMKTVDKYKAKFYEKENIFDRFLPYAILFGMTYSWIKKMREIYGDQYFKNYTPAWYAGNIESFNFEDLSSTLSSLSSSIASTMSSYSSGIDGMGIAGGGSGGGGGGGW